MRQISTWARGHVWASRLLIIFLLYPLLNAFGLLLGFLLEDKGTHFSLLWAYPLSLLTILTWLAYPSRSNRHRYRNFYWRQKTMDVSMAVLTFCFIVLAGNNWFAGESTAAGNSYAAAISPTSEGKPLTKKEKRMKKFLQRMVARYHKMSGGGKAALITLAVLVAIGLILLLGAAACSISCGGSEAGAFIVFFLGLGVIIFALVRVIERISKGPRKKKMEGAISQ